jgi:7 transmembrane receptor (Secretin family).
LFGCAFFAWLFAEALHLYLSTRIVIDKGDGRLALFYFIGWGKLCDVFQRSSFAYIGCVR